MNRASVDGITLEYEEAGHGEPVVMIHGAIIADTFRPLLAEPSLTNRFRLINYHRRGYAGSDAAVGPDSLERQAADCRALLAALGVTRAHVVGHSSGGAIALQLALDSPGVVNSLVVLEPALAIGTSGEAYRAALARGREGFRTAAPAVVVDEFLQARWPGYRERLDKVLPGGLAQAVADAGTAFEIELPALLNWSFGEGEVRQIRQPVLSVLGGESEALWPRFGETHRLLLAWLPNAEEFVVPGATHFMQLGYPGEVAEALAGFFARHPMGNGRDVPKVEAGRAVE